MNHPARWALSPLNCKVHLLAPSDENPINVLKARCGALLAIVAIQHDQPPPGPPCERCHLIYLADLTARDTSNSQGAPVRLTYL